MPKKRKKQKSSIRTDEVLSPFGNGTDRVTRNFTDVILHMYRRKSLTEGQYQAAEMFKNAYDVFQGQRNLAIDYSKERVDTSGITQPLSRAQLHAADLISQFNKAIGREQRYIIQLVAGENWSLAQFALYVHGESGRHAIRGYKKILVEGLEELSRLWGFSARSTSRGKFRHTGQAA